ncbi:hypothetical protein ARTHRO9AX_140017 [Arthrobacter sp. 9AX]|nr:hypothetical protein ARTHRO9AX_140017 [Arthrobacter sp. 9AX]
MGLPAIRDAYPSTHYWSYPYPPDFPRVEGNQYRSLLTP